MSIYFDLFFTFFKIGLFTIGGGYAMIPLISTSVTTKGWITHELLVDFIAIAESTPGPFSINVATFVGNSAGGILGGVCAVLGLLVPSFVIIFCIYKISKKFLANKYVKDAFTALRPAIVGLVASAVITVMLKSFFTKLASSVEINIIGLGLSAVIFFLMNKFKKIHPIVFILMSAVIGIAVYSFFDYRLII